MVKNNIKIAIIDYEAGNLYSVQHACNFVGAESKITSDVREIMAADGVILPGVGAFGEAMDNLRKKGLIDPIRDFVKSGKPFMGVCLGLQLLFTQSEEFGLHQGLNLIEGEVKRFPNKNPKGKAVRVPQIGWNQIKSQDKNRWKKSPFKNLADNEFMYFVHSFFVTPKDKKDILSTSNYEGIEYCSSILRDNLFATQFHPEKSAQEGIKIYKNWTDQVKSTKERSK